MKKLIIAAVAATLSVSGAFAAESAFPAVEPVALRVSTNGLNLSNPRDVATLQKRIDKAIDAACNPHGSYFAELAPERECRAQLTTNTNQILANLAKKAEKSRMAEF
jgi:UrcA family protein